MDIYLCEKALGLLEDIPCFRNKAVYKLACYRFGGVQRDNKLAHELYLLVLKRLDKRHSLVKLHSVGVENVVKFIVVYLHILAQHRKAAQKGCVVNLLAVHFADCRHEVSRILTVGVCARIKIDTDALAYLLPHLLGFLRGHRRSVTGVFVCLSRHAFVISAVPALTGVASAGRPALFALSVLGRSKLVLSAHVAKLGCAVGAVLRLIPALASFSAGACFGLFVPYAVIVGIEIFPYASDLLRRQILLDKIAVYSLRRKARHLLLELIGKP